MAELSDILAMGEKIGFTEDKISAFLSEAEAFFVISSLEMLRDIVGKNELVHVKCLR